MPITDWLVRVQCDNEALAIGTFQLYFLRHVYVRLGPKLSANGTSDAEGFMLIANYRDTSFTCLFTLATTPGKARALANIIGTRPFVVWEPWGSPGKRYEVRPNQGATGRQPYRVVTVI